MSVKKKISNTDFIMATKAVAIARKVLESGCVKDFFHATNYCMFGTPESVKPFDMIANGLMIGNVPDKVLGDFVADWMSFLNLFKKEDAHDELFVAFLMMVGMMANSEIELSHAAFAGVYGNFRVALSRCWMDKLARIDGRKSYDDVVEALKRSKDVAAKEQERMKREIEIMRLIASGGEDRKVIVWGYQYPEIAKIVKAHLLRAEREGVIKNTIRRVKKKKKIGNKEIKPNSGLVENDERRGKYATIRRRLIADGVWTV